MENLVREACATLWSVFQTSRGTQESLESWFVIGLSSHRTGPLPRLIRLPLKGWIRGAILNILHLAFENLLLLALFYARYNNMCPQSPTFYVNCVRACLCIFVCICKRPFSCTPFWRHPEPTSNQALCESHARADVRSFLIMSRPKQTVASEIRTPVFEPYFPLDFGQFFCQTLCWILQ